MCEGLSKRVWVFILTSMLLGLSAVSAETEDKNSFDCACTASKTLYVGGNGPNNYTKIQDAIDDANPGDTVFVYNGTYYENLLIDKPIKLIGEDKEGTTVDGKKQGNTVCVISENVVISGFTITNGSLGDELGDENWFYAGIRLTASNSTICGNNICNNTLGVFGKKVSNVTIFDNEFTGDGIVFSLYDNEKKPVPFCEKYFMQNVYNNTVNGKRIYYYKNQKDVNVPEDAGQVIAVNCQNITMRCLGLLNADYGCVLVNCSDCVVEYSNISWGDGMVWLIHSKNNRIQHNQFLHNFEGICIDCKSTKNVVQYNTFSNNKRLGVIVEYQSNYNRIYKNNFIENNQKDNSKVQVYFINSYFNEWDQNYWGKPRVFPKIIFGKIGLFGNIPWFNFDLHPLSEPYRLGSVL